MFNPDEIIHQLLLNARAFHQLLDGLESNDYLFKPSNDKWCLLEIICHLHDEECEDFRARTLSILEDPNKDFIPINPVAWVSDRAYLDQDFSTKLSNFLSERQKSIELLKELENPNWSNTYNHPTLGKITAAKMLSNWLAHDYIHLRQIIKVKRARLASELSDDDLGYAGNW